MKSVLISIQPKWCKRIANGSKTIEVRKTKPKLETPFKVYIYCTKQKVNGEILLTHDKKVEGRNRGFRDTGDIPLAGKVIGEFVCDYFYDMCQFGFGIAIYNKDKILVEPQDLLDWSCLTENQLLDYIGNKDGYCWHISNLVIYDKPRELSEFITPTTCKSGIAKEMLCNTCCLSANFCSKKPKRITRPPQSWCYVESEVDAK